MSDVLKAIGEACDSIKWIESEYPAFAELRTLIKEGRIRIDYPDPRRCVKCSNISGKHTMSRTIEWPKFCPECGAENPSGK